MKQIRVVIVDDEPIAIDVIKELISELAPDLSVVDTASNGREAIEKIQSVKPDLVFMDVDMPLMNGLTVLQKIPHQSFLIIFTTGFAPNALRTNAYQNIIDYLWKPIDPTEFLAAILKARERFAAQNKLPGK